jgi:hypothetical protein
MMNIWHVSPLDLEYWPDAIIADIDRLGCLPMNTAAEVFERGTAHPALRAVLFLAILEVDKGWYRSNAVMLGFAGVVVDVDHSKRVTSILKLLYHWEHGRAASTSR